MAKEKSTALLFARPSTEMPYAIFADLQKGTYTECSYLSLKTFICFTDMGDAAWKAALEMDEVAKIRLYQASWLEEDKEWSVRIAFLETTLELESKRYSQFGKMPQTFYMILRFNGPREQIQRYCRRIVKKLRRKPYILLNWDDLERETGYERPEVVDGWKDLLGKELASEDRIESEIYAAPTTKEPYVLYKKLFSGEYEECKMSSVYTYISFTDVGDAIYKAARAIDTKASIRLTKASLLEEDKAWTIEIEFGEDLLTLECIRYKPLGDQLKAFYIRIGFHGEEKGLEDLMNKFTENLGHDPRENLDWDALEKKKDLDREALQQTLPFKDEDGEGGDGEGAGEGDGKDKKDETQNEE